MERNEEQQVQTPNTSRLTVRRSRQHPSLMCNKCYGCDRLLEPVRYAYFGTINNVYRIATRGILLRGTATYDLIQIPAHRARVRSLLSRFAPAKVGYLALFANYNIHSYMCIPRAYN